jgi:hypothetical protein
VSLRTRDVREAARRAARLNLLAEAGWAMEIPDHEVRVIMQALSARYADVPPLPPALPLEAESRIETEARRALAGLPHRLDDPDFLDSILVEPPTPAEEAYAAALLRGDAPDAVDGELVGTASAPPAAQSERRAQKAVMPARNGRQEPPGEAPSPSARANLRYGDPDGWLAFTGRYIDRRLAGFLCEEADEIPDLAVGQRWRGGSWGNYLTAVRLCADAMGNRRLRHYTPEDAREFLALLARTPARKGDRQKPVREPSPTPTQGSGRPRSRSRPAGHSRAPSGSPRRRRACRG